MRLKYSIMEEYLSIINFWQKACNYEGKSSCLKGRCCNPKTNEYQNRCAEIRREWHDAGGIGKLPVMPLPTVECEKCEYTDLTLGAYEGSASLRTINRHVEGTIPVPLKGRKKVWLDNVDQKQLESVLNAVDFDIEAFALTGSPTIRDFSFGESFPNLKYAYIWWNNNATHLWDITKTPNLEYLYLERINSLSDISQLQNAKNLRYLFIYGGNDISSLQPLEHHPSLQFIVLYRLIADTDLRPLITIPNLRYLNCHPNIFNIEDYAMFEAKRPDVDTNFWEGIEGYADKPNQYFTQLVGRRQRLVKPDDYVRQEKHKQKYLAIKEKFLSIDK